MNLDEAFGPETAVVLAELSPPVVLPPVELTDEQRWRLLLWVKALRSGIFTQGREYLARLDSDGRWLHCCLGVGCEVAVIQGLDIQVKEGTASYRTLAVKSYDNEKCTMPDRVREWYGIPDVDVMLPLGVLDFYDSDEVDSAAEANDAHRLSFDQIADLIVARFGLDEGVGDGE